jgi:hypothetical protein
MSLRAERFQQERPLSAYRKRAHRALLVPIPSLGVRATRPGSLYPVPGSFRPPRGLRLDP